MSQSANDYMFCCYQNFADVHHTYNNLPKRECKESATKTDKAQIIAIYLEEKCHNRVGAYT